MKITLKQLKGLIKEMIDTDLGIGSYEADQVREKAAELNRIIQDCVRTADAIPTDNVDTASLIELRRIGKLSSELLRRVNSFFPVEDDSWITKDLRN